jgi:hypothetical protein
VLRTGHIPGVYRNQAVVLMAGHREAPGKGGAGSLARLERVRPKTFMVVRVHVTCINAPGDVSNDPGVGLNCSGKRAEDESDLFMRSSHSGSAGEANYFH